MRVLFTPAIAATLALAVAAALSPGRVDALSSTPAFSSSTKAPRTPGPQPQPQPQPVGNVLILDHLNINHQKGRHDLLRAFYFDFLRCAVDPRKEENLARGTKTLWANVGAMQFHLPEGRPDAQVFGGTITLSYSDLGGLRERMEDESIRTALSGSKFHVVEDATREGEDDEDALLVTDPWGSKFRLVKSKDPEAESNAAGGTQGGGPSEGIALRDLTVEVTRGSNVAGIARFYDQILGAPTLSAEEGRCVISVGPMQTLTFLEGPEGETISHDDMIDDDDDGEVVEGRPRYLSNYGPHLSVYVADLRSAYRKASELGVAYVNPRFKRRAYDEEEAVDDCMFRCIDVVDPEDKDAGPILRLEHEVRSVIKRDGSKYKSCPLEEIPEGCRI